MKENGESNQMRGLAKPPISHGNRLRQKVPGKQFAIVSLPSELLSITVTSVEPRAREAVEAPGRRNAMSLERALRPRAERRSLEVGSSGCRMPRRPVAASGNARGELSTATVATASSWPTTRYCNNVLLWRESLFPAMFQEPT